MTLIIRDGLRGIHLNDRSLTEARDPRTAGVIYKNIGLDNCR